MKILEKQAMLTVSNKKYESTTIAYLIAVNGIDITEDDCIKKIENAMAEEIEVANELQKVLSEAEKSGFFIKEANN